MGWRRDLQRLESAQRRHDRDVERANRRITREADKSLNRVDSDRDRAMKKARSFDERMRSNPLKALKLRYSDSTGRFQSEPFEINTTYMHGTVDIVGQDNGSQNGFSPARAEGEGFSIEPLALSISEYGFLVAIRVSGTDNEYRIKLNWVKKADPATSSVFLVDAVNSEYYYPKASSLTGEVIPGHPKIGIVAFETPRRATALLELHISGVKLNSQRGNRESFTFVSTGPELEGEIERVLSEEPFLGRLERQLDDAALQLSSQIVETAENSMVKPGCMGCSTLTLTGMVAVLSMLVLAT